MGSNHGAMARISGPFGTQGHRYLVDSRVISDETSTATTPPIRRPEWNPGPGWRVGRFMDWDERAELRDRGIDPDDLKAQLRVAYIRYLMWANGLPMVPLRTARRPGGRARGYWPRGRGDR